MKTLCILAFTACLVAISTANGNIGDGLADLKAYPYYRGIAPMAPGSVWPKPQNQKSKDSYLLVKSRGFEFVGETTCNMITDAYSRYIELMFYPRRGRTLVKIPDPTSDVSRKWEKDNDFVGYLLNFYVNLTSACEQWPHENMDESYDIEITKKGGVLTAKTNWGILRGLETFSQLVFLDNFGAYRINLTSISDYPRFGHRGTMLDTARHFLTKKVILENIEAMSYAKYNVFHWHIVDDQSFPYQSAVFPLLTEKGAFNPFTHVYSISDMAEIIEYARIRGIRVIPEFDTPGHSYSWGKAYPELLTPCYKSGENGALVFDDYGPIDPTRNTTYDFVKTLFNEVTRLFPDNYIHLGGDEVPFDCWKSNPNVTAFMKNMGWNASDYARLEEYYMTQVIGNLPANSSYVVWQEIFDNGVKVKPDTIIHVWKAGQKDEMERVTQAGLHSLLSSCWYLNYVSYGINWYDYYTCEPYAFNASAEVTQTVLGGEACMWTEYQDSTSVISNFWPGAIAPAERLWSAKHVNSTDEAAPRYEEMRCRMVKRGINASPGNGPSYCEVDDV